MLGSRKTKISPIAFTTPLPPSGTRNTHNAHLRKMVIKNNEKLTITKRMKNGYEKMEKINNIVQFVEMAVAIVLIL